MKGQDLSKEELLAAIEELNRRLLEHEPNRGETKWLEKSLRSRTHDLSERVKELECVYSLLQISTREDNPFERGVEKIIRIIRDGWQYP